MSHPHTETFSDRWHRVEHTRPRISPHARVIRQSRAGRIDVIIEEPASGSFYRINRSAEFFLGLLDGRRTAGEAWEACVAQLGDDAPSQRECVDALAKLQMFGLLLGSDPLAADMMSERQRRGKSTRLKKRVGWFVFPSIKLVDPEPVLQRLVWLCRLLFSWPGFVAWLALIGSAGWMVVGERRELFSSLNGVLAPGNLLWLGVIFLLTRAAHEMGHAMACKAFGGRVRDIGVIMIGLLLPLPYCDATSAWRFERTMPRVIVSAAGMYLEIAIAAVAAIVWAASDPGIARTLSYNVMVVSSFVTLVFNLNPLLRYDGYYILMDLSGVHNLSQRSMERWKHLIERRLFGVTSRFPAESRGRVEDAFIFLFGALSAPYRIFVLVAIAMVLAATYPGIGLVFAVLALTISVVVPVLKFVWYLAGSTMLIGRRLRAVSVTLGVLALVFGALGLIPAPAAAVATGVIETGQTSTVRSGEAGFVSEVLAEIGQPVEQGEVLLRLRNPELELELTRAQFNVKRANAERDRAMTQSSAEVLIAERAIGQYEAQLRRLRDRVAALEIRANASGVVAPATAEAWTLSALDGRYVDRGIALAQIIAPDDPAVLVSMPSSEASALFARRRGSERSDLPVEARARGTAWRVLDGQIDRVTPLSDKVLRDRALGATAGGSLLLDPNDPAGETTLAPTFEIRVRLPEAEGAVYAGQRARVRFAMPPEPLLRQWYRSITGYIEERLG